MGAVTGRVVVGLADLADEVHARGAGALVLAAGVVDAAAALVGLELTPAWHVRRRPLAVWTDRGVLLSVGGRGLVISRLDRL